MLADFVDELREIALDCKVSVQGDRIVVTADYHWMLTAEDPLHILLQIRNLTYRHGDCLRSITSEPSDSFWFNTPRVILHVADNTQLVLW